MKDVVYCPHASHLVSREKLTWINTENGRRRKICTDCRETVMKARAELAKNKGV